MTLAYIINNLLFVVPCILLLLLVFRDQIKTPSFIWVFTGSSLFLIFSFWGTHIYLIYNTPTQRMLLSIAALFSGVLIFSSVCRYSFWQSLFIISIIKSYSENVRFLSSYLHFLFTGTLPGHGILSISCLMTVLTALTFPAMFLFYSRLMRPALDCTFSLSVWKWVWVIPVSGNAFYTLTVTPEFSNYSAYPDNKFFFLPPLWILLTFSTYIILLKMIIDVSKSIVLRENLRLSEIQIEAQQKQMNLLQSTIRESRSFRHDIRHHFLALEGFFHDDDMEGLKTYIRQSAALIPRQTVQIYCYNTALNALLCYYTEQAEKEHIKVSSQISLPEMLCVPDAELCIIIGNLLENAVEACQRMKSQDRFLDISMSAPSNFILLIQVRNSYEGTVRQAQDGSFLSSKRKDRKGIGISSVLSITEKYSGIAKIEHQEQIFEVSLLLNHRPEADGSAQTGNGSK